MSTDPCFLRFLLSLLIRATNDPCFTPSTLCALTFLLDPLKHHDGQQQGCKKPMRSTGKVLSEDSCTLASTAWEEHHACSISTGISSALFNQTQATGFEIPIRRCTWKCKTGDSTSNTSTVTKVYLRHRPLWVFQVNSGDNAVAFMEQQSWWRLVQFLLELETMG